MSEQSRGVEAGLRFGNDFLNANIGAFSTKYTDFIESFALAPAFLRFRGIDPSDGMLTFQSINRGEVEIQGLEASGEAELFLPNTSLRFAFASASGTDEVADQPLDSVNPFTSVLGVRYDGNNGRWGTEIVWTLVAAKDSGDIAETSSRVPTAGYGIVDVLVDLNIGSKIDVNLGVFNLTDKRYIRWEDTVAIGSDAHARFTQPGVNAGITIRARI